VVQTLKRSPSRGLGCAFYIPVCPENTSSSSASRRCGFREDLSRTKQIRYAVKRREALTRFCDDAGLEADNNRAENCLRPRKNYLFAGSDAGGERAAAIYTLIQTARLNFVDPEAWVREGLTRIADGHPANRIGELAPWCFSAPETVGNGFKWWSAGRQFWSGDNQ
jgi:hypothetical protein